MTIKVELSGFNAVAEMAWGGAKAVCQEIFSQGREQEAMGIIEEIFAGCEPTDTTLNDFIWFGLGDQMNLWGNEEDEDSEEEQEDSEEEQEANAVDFATIAKNHMNIVCIEIIRQGREQEAMRHIKEEFVDRTPTETELDDSIWGKLTKLMKIWDNAEV